MDGVVHFELPMDDVARGKKFYSETFGWELEDMPEMKYVIARTGEVDENRMPKTPGVIGGGLMALIFYSNRHGYDDLSGGDGGKTS